MPTSKRVEDFIAKVETNKHAEAMEAFYAENASIQENQTKPRIGKVNLIENERNLLAQAKKVNSKCIRPVLINGDHVVIKWKFQFIWLNDTITEIEEVAFQLWEDEHILQEQFFYDPAQMVPKKLPK